MTALAGKLVAVSVSDAPDRARLGFPRREVDRALLTICTAVVRAGADIAYAGNLDPDGYTFKIFRHLAGAYAGQKHDTPFRHFVPEPVGRVTRYEVLLATIEEGRATVRTELARGNGFVVAELGGGGIRLADAVVRNDDEFIAWYATVPTPAPADAFTAARRMVSQLADARVVFGGKMGVLDDPADAYQGAMPGVVEEAILTLEQGKPLVTLGAFGGAARDIAIALGLVEAAKAVPRGNQLATYAPAIERISALRARIPAEMVPGLAQVADDDRSEQCGFATALLIEQWSALREHGG